MQQTNEALKDYLSMISQALDPVARAHKLGTREVQNLTKQAVSKFVRYMGRNRQDWNNVTWNTLYKFLTIRDLFGLTAAEINAMVLDQETKNKITNIVKNLPANYMTDFYAKPSKTIGGDMSVNGAADRSQTIATIILELASIQHLNKAAGGEDIPDPTASGSTQSSNSSSGGPTTASAPKLVKPTIQTSSDPVLNQLYVTKHRIEMALYQLQGGTP